MSKYEDIRDIFTCDVTFAYLFIYLIFSSYRSSKLTGAVQQGNTDCHGHIPNS